MICSSNHSHREPYLCCSGVCHLFVQADVQIVAWLVGQEEPNGNRLPSWSQTDVDLQLSLEHAELPQATPVAHHHAPHRLLDLKTQEKNSLHPSGHIHPSATPPSPCCEGLLKWLWGNITQEERWKHRRAARVQCCHGPLVSFILIPTSLEIGRN